MKKTLKDIKPGRILIRSTNWVGDAIMTTPAVRTIRQNFPEAHIAVLVHPWVADVFSASPFVDEIIPYYKKDLHKGVGGMFRLARQLAAHKFDTAILLQNAFEAAFITTLAAIPVRAGYKRDCRGPLLSHGVAIDPEIRKIHQVHYYQAMLSGLGLTPGSDELFLALPEKDLAWAHNLLAQEKVSRPLVGLNPGAAYGPAKRWPAEKYGDLAALVDRQLGGSVAVFGTRDDQKAAAAILERCPCPIVDLTGRTSLAQAMAMISLCDGFVTNDSGLMHVAAALQTPLVAIFGSTDHVATGPFSPTAAIIRKELSCSPCLKTHCSTDFQCMNTIEPAEVLEKLLPLLKNEQGSEHGD